MRKIMLLLTGVLILSLIGCVGLGSNVRKTTIDGIEVEAVSSDRFRIYGENLKPDDPTFTTMATKLCGQYMIIPPQKSDKQKSIEIQCTEHVLEYNPSTENANFVPDKTSEYAIRAVMDAGGAPIDSYEFSDTKPASKILFYKRSDKVHPILFTYNPAQSIYTYQSIWAWDRNKFHEIKNTSKYIQSCKEWYSNELAKKAGDFKTSAQTEKYIETILFLENEVSPLGGLALKELSQFYSDSNNQKYNNSQKAISIAEQMVSRDRSSVSLNSLATAYAEAGEFNKAADVVEQAIPLAKNDEEKTDLEVNLDLFRAKKAPSSMSKSDWAGYYYDKAVLISNGKDSRKATVFFAKATSYVPDYKDAALLRDKYKRIADDADAETYYQDGLRLLKDSKFQDAATAFDKAQEFVPGYKDSAKLAEEAKNAMPNEEQLYKAISRALGSEIPVSWVGNLMGGRLLRLDDLQVARLGIYNQDKKYWPMKIRCTGVAALNDMFNKGKTVRFDKVGEFIVYRDDYGDWQASMRGGMFQ